MLIERTEPGQPVARLRTVGRGRGTPETPTSRPTRPVDSVALGEAAACRSADTTHGCTRAVMSDHIVLRINGAHDMRVSRDALMDLPESVLILLYACAIEGWALIAQVPERRRSERTDGAIGRRWRAG